jgi:hypothetical protein
MLGQARAHLNQHLPAAVARGIGILRADFHQLPLKPGQCRLIVAMFGGYTSIPKSSSITGRSGCRTDSRASPLTRGAPRLSRSRGRPGSWPEADCVTSVLILVRVSAACAMGLPHFLRFRR